jgi:hypothetical protein
VSITAFILVIDSLNSLSSVVFLKAPSIFVTHDPGELLFPDQVWQGYHSDSLNLFMKLIHTSTSNLSMKRSPELSFLFFGSGNLQKSSTESLAVILQLEVVDRAYQLFPHYSLVFLFSESTWRGA